MKTITDRQMIRDGAGEAVRLFGPLSEGVFRNAYAIDDLKLLCAAIRGADEQRAREYLNVIINTLYERLQDEENGLRWQVAELFIRMSRAAMRAGAEKSELAAFCGKHLERMDTRKTDELKSWLHSGLTVFLSYVMDLSGVTHKQVVSASVEYIRRHLAEKISLSEAASHVNLSRSYFCKILKDELGCSYTTLQNRLRIEHSCQLLSQGVSIAEAAQEVGFDDQSYFTKCFRTVLGVTPGQYRNSRV